MQMKKLFIASIISINAFGAFANATERESKFIENENKSRPNEVQFELRGNSKEMAPDNIVVEPKPSTVIEEFKEDSKNSRFKPVPLVGEIEYYGENNKALITYTSNYMRNFGGRIGKRANKDQIFATMDKILESYEIPKELKYLAVIESALNGNARSRAGAVGYWQFMAPTARDMGLVVNNKRDDRKNLVRSTHGAAKYLSYLYDQLEDWLLVIAAYNSGPRPVINAIKRTGKNDFWAIKPYLPKETQNHVMAFVATATIMEKLDQYIDSGLPSDFDWASLNRLSEFEKRIQEEEKNPLLKRFSKDELQKMAIIRIKKPMQFEKICAILSIDSRLLNRWNYDYAEFIREYEPGKEYNLKIPKEKLELFLQKRTQIEKQSQF